MCGVHHFAGSIWSLTGYAVMIIALTGADKQPDSVMLLCNLFKAQKITSRRDCCLQVIFGGRNGVGYFNDVWAFRLSTGVWEEWTPTDGNAASPMGRDHFGAVYDAGHMYIFGKLLKYYAVPSFMLRM